ncbi:MAG: VCBS repeat-containing protein [bacterium]
MRVVMLLLTGFFFLSPVSVCGVPSFKAVVIDSDFASGYHAAIGDIDGDGLPDIIGLSEGDGGYVAWYKNPAWEKSRISPESIRSPIDVLTKDIDEDGDLDVAMIHDFHYSDDTSEGAVSWLENTGRFDEPWPVHPIGHEPTLHRIRWMDLDCDGIPEILGAPILALGSEKPDYVKTTVRLEAYEAPTDRTVSPWQDRLIDDSLHLLHGLTPLDWDADGREDFLTASHEGITLFLNRPDGLKRQPIAEGHRSDTGDQGSSEVERGHLAEDRAFIAAIEPRHGHEVVVYLPGETKDSWRRLVIDDSFVTGHALNCADLDGDGDDEIVAGYRGKGTSLYIYECADQKGERWTRIPLDQGGMAANCSLVFDVEGDGDLDLVCIGGATHNIKLYINQSQD